MDQQDFRSAFVELLETLCEQGRASFAQEVPGEPEALIVDMIIGGADVRLAHAHPAAPDISLEFDYGILPLAPEALPMLLELNAMLMKQGQDGFCLDAESGSLVRHCICPFAMLDASVLARQMVAIGGEASAWLSASFPEMRDAGVDGGQRPDPIDLSNELKAGTYARPTPILWG